MKYHEVAPCASLEPFIHSFWELKGEDHDGQWERIFPDGCPGIVVNLGEPCKTDNGLVTMDHGKTYVVGAMTSFKDSFIEDCTHLLGICFKPAAFSTFYSYAPQSELTNSTIQFDRSRSLDPGQLQKNPVAYLNRHFLDKRKRSNPLLRSVLEDIDTSKGKLTIHDLSKRHFTTVRQLERNFGFHIGLTPKEYANVIRFQSALSMIRQNSDRKKLFDIAIECGFYDQAHLTNFVKRHTGFAPSEL